MCFHVLNFILKSNGIAWAQNSDHVVSRYLKDRLEVFR